jgi:phosphoserine phosphatase
MKIYLIRHGQSEARVIQKRQGPDTPLSKEGRSQAVKIAKRVKGIEVSEILSSPWERALETAQIIARKTKLPLSIVDYIHEKTMHPDLYYVDVESDINKLYTKRLYENYEDFNWRFKGKGESISQVHKRAIKFKKQLLSSYKNKNIVVVTHGVFLYCFVMACIVENDFSEKQYMNQLVSYTYTNTGLTLIEYDELTDKWKLIFLNDISHLGA